MATATGLVDHVVRPHVAVTEDRYLHAPVSSSQAFLPADAPPGITRVVSALVALFEARDMGQHCAPMPVLARDVVWDAPPFLLSRKGSVRVSAYFLKFFAKQRFVPSHIEARRVGLDNTLLEVAGTLEVFPRRTWLVPASKLLPAVVPIRTTLLVGVNGPLDSGEVELVVAKWHNLPSLPNFVRAFNGLVFGTLPHLLEPVWSYAPEFMGDDFYRRRREATFGSRHPNSSLPALDAAKDVVSDTATGVMDYGVSSVRNLSDGASYLWTNFMEAAGFTVGRARAYAGATVDVASKAAGTAAHVATDVAGTAYGVAATAANMAANVASTAAGTAYGVASTAAGTAANVAGTAANAAYNAAGTAANVASDVAARTYDTAAGAAESAYDTTTVAAQKTYATAAGATQAARDAGTAAAGAAYETGREGLDAGRRGVEVASIRAQDAAEDARRGYEMGKAKPVHIHAPVALAPAGVTTTTTATATDNTRVL